MSALNLMPIPLIDILDFLINVKKLVLQEK